MHPGQWEGWVGRDCVGWHAEGLQHWSHRSRHVGLITLVRNTPSTCPWRPSRHRRRVVGPGAHGLREEWGGSYVAGSWPRPWEDRKLHRHKIQGCWNMWQCSPQVTADSVSQVTGLVIWDHVAVMKGEPPKHAENCVIMSWLRQAIAFPKVATGTVDRTFLDKSCSTQLFHKR